MVRFFRLWLGLLVRCLRSRRGLLMENLVLRQQLTVLKRKHPKPRLSALWRSELCDGDVREVQKKGGKVVVMRPDYELPDLEDARKQCAEAK